MPDPGISSAVSGVRDGDGEREWLAARINTPRAMTQRYVEELVFHVFYNGPLAGSKERIAKAFLALAAEDTSARNVPAGEGQSSSPSSLVGDGGGASVADSGGSPPLRAAKSETGAGH